MLLSNCVSKSADDEFPLFFVLLQVLSASMSCWLCWSFRESAVSSSTYDPEEYANHDDAVALIGAHVRNT
jgi:hypothetical protein